MKKIAVIISGNIRMYKENLSFLKDIFKDCEVTIFSSVWDHQNEITEFEKFYNIRYLQKIKEQKWDEKVNQVKFVTGEENRGFKIKNIFHMWFSVVENIKFLKETCANQNLSFDYVCRFRTDIFCKNKTDYFKKEIEKIKTNEILFPVNNHHRGLNDQFFIAEYTTFLKLSEILNYIDIFLKEERPFNPEYIFYLFVKQNNLKVKLAHKFDVDLIRAEQAKPTKKVFIPFKDRMNLKKARYLIRVKNLFNKIKYLFN